MVRTLRMNKVTTCEAFSTFENVFNCCSFSTKLLKFSLTVYISDVVWNNGNDLVDHLDTKCGLGTCAGQRTPQVSYNATSIPSHYAHKTGGPSLASLQIHLSVRKTANYTRCQAVP